MIVVIPFTGQTAYTESLSEALLHFGGLGSHRLIVPTPAEHLGEAEVFLNGLKVQFMVASIVPVAHEAASNVLLFRDSLLASARIQPLQQEIHNAPILWLEPGWLPTRREWASDLSAEFYNLGGGTKILGHWVRQPDFKVGHGVSLHTVAGGWHSVGPTVFPSQYVRGNELIERINNASAPWRVRLQFEDPAARISSTLLSPKGQLFTNDTAKPKPVVKPIEAEIAPVVSDEVPTEIRPKRRVASRAPRVATVDVPVDVPVESPAP